MAQKGGSGLPETRTAMQELLAELDQTRREYAKVSLQLTQQDALVQHMKGAEAKKDQVISFLQEELAKMNQLYGKESEVRGEESKTKILELEHRNKYLEIEVTHLQEEASICASFEKENRQLRESLLQHQAVVEKLQAANEDLRTRSNAEMSGFRTQLEVEFKRRLSEAEKKFRAEAYRALTDEAKVALQGNDHLQVVLQRQNDSIEGVLSRCKQLESSHDRLKTEQEMSQQNLKQHQDDVQKLRRQLSDSKAKNTQLEEALKQRRVERASLELLFLEYEATRKELAKAEGKVRQAKREGERWRSRAIKISSDVGQADTVQQMEDVARRQEKIDEQLRKEKTRRDRRQRLRQKRADTAQRLEAAEGEESGGGATVGFTTDPTSSDYDRSAPTSDKEGRETSQQRVNPMDVLAMWNINFEAWTGEGAAAAAAAGIKPGGSGAGGVGDEVEDGGNLGDTEGGEQHQPVPPAQHPPPPAPPAEEGVGGGGGGGGGGHRVPHHQQHQQRGSQESTMQARLRADRQLSVLSQHSRRPQQRFYKAGGGGGGPRSRTLDEAAASSTVSLGHSLTVVNADGEFATRKKKYPNVAQGAAAAAAPNGNRFFVP